MRDRTAIQILAGIHSVEGFTLCPFDYTHWITKVNISSLSGARNLELLMGTWTKDTFLKGIEKTYPLTFISNELDKKTEEIALNKSQLISLLTEHRVVDDKSVPAFIPGAFSKSNSKSASDVKSISMIVYDVDCKTRFYTLKDLKERLSDYTCIVHSTYSATFEAPRWRVIILPEKPIEPHNFDSVYRGVAEKLDLEFDLKCTNINRLFYLPSVSSLNDFVFSWSNNASLIKTSDYETNKPKALKRKGMNTGYVTCSSVQQNSFARPTISSGKICGFDVPKTLKAPFTQDEFDELLSHPGSWLTAAAYMGLPVDLISSTRTYSKSFSSVLPGVDDVNPSCSLGLLSDKTRLVYFAFNEEHEGSHRSGPVKIDLAHVYAMMKCGRRIEREAFKAGTHKVWLTRLMIDAGMIIPEPVEDLPDLPEEAKSAERLYTGFKDLLMCKRAFVEQQGDATSFSLTFACYWCKIGNRNTAKKYTQLLLDHGVLRFVDKIELPRGGSIPLLIPAGRTAKMYHIRKRNKVTEVTAQPKQEVMAQPKQEASLSSTRTGVGLNSDSKILPLHPCKVPINKSIPKLGDDFMFSTSFINNSSEDHQHHYRKHMNINIKCDYG